MKGDRRLVEHQKKYEQRIQFLMNKLRDAESNEAQDDRITYVEAAKHSDLFFIKYFLASDTGHHFRPLLLTQFSCRRGVGKLAGVRIKRACADVNLS